MQESNNQKLVESIIKDYNLALHIQGGYFKRIYQSPQIHNNRFKMTSILYLLTKNKPSGKWGLNKSDIIHYHLQGGSIKYDLIYQDGKHQTVVLGSNYNKGQKKFLIVKGGIYKCFNLQNGDYSLISQAVCPGFDYQDFKLFKQQQLMQKFPDLKEIIDKKK